MTTIYSQLNIVSHICENTKRVGIAPLSNVPPEILGEIFENIVSGTLAIPSSEFDTIWNVAQTCSMWRSVALGLYHIWSNLEVSLLLQHKETVPRFASECLRRGGNMPLSITLTNSGWFDPFVPRFIIPHTSRIQYLNVYPLSMISTMKLVFPNLRHLEVHSEDCHGDMGWAALLTRSECRLTQLTVSGSSLSWDRVLEQITSLEELCIMATMSFETIQRMSKQEMCPALKSIKCSVTENVLDAFIKMLEARPMIVDVTVRFINYDGDDGQLKKVNYLKDRGVCVELYDRFDPAIPLALCGFPQSPWFGEWDSDSNTDEVFR